MQRFITSVLGLYVKALFMIKKSNNQQYLSFEATIVCIGVILRFINAGSPELWRDEAFSVMAAEFSVQRMLKVIMKDTAPPLHYFILKGWISVFGDSQVSVRLPSIIAGITSILIFWKLTHKCFQKFPKARLAALGLYVTNCEILVYDRMARVYSLVIAITLGLLYSLVKIVEESDTKLTYVIISLLTTLGLWSYNIFPLIGFVNLIFFLCYGNKTQRIKVLGAYFIAGLLYLPIFITITLKQYSVVTETFLTHFTFLPILSLFELFGQLLVGQAHYSSRIIDYVVRAFPFLVFRAFLGLTLLACLKFLSLKSKMVKVLLYWMLTALILVWIYSLKSMIIYARYQVFFAPILFLVLADLYRHQTKIIAIIVVLSLFASAYEVNVGVKSVGNHAHVLQAISHNPPNTLIICMDGASYHTLKLYSKLPIYIYDPQRVIPYYHGTAIFEQQDYFDGDFGKYQRVFVLSLGRRSDIERKLVEEGFRKEKRRNKVQFEYEFDIWNRIKNLPDPS